MSQIASKYYPVSEMFFSTNKEVDLAPGGGIVKAHEVEPMGIHIFKWGAESFMEVETWSKQLISFPSTAFVEGAVYYIKIRKLVKTGPNSDETNFMVVSSSESL